MSIKILNDNVAIKPFVFDHDKGQGQKMVAGFYGTDKLSKTIVSSEIVFDSEGFTTGQKVHFKADIYNFPYVKAILKIEDKEFILVPKQLVIAVG